MNNATGVENRNTPFHPSSDYFRTIRLFRLTEGKEEGQKLLSTVVYEREDGETVVAAMDAVASMIAVENPGLESSAT